MDQTEGSSLLTDHVYVEGQSTFDKENVYIEDHVYVDKDGISLAPVSTPYRVTVEPVVFCYAFGILLHVPIIQQYIYSRISESKRLVTNTTEHSSNCDNRALEGEVGRLLQETQTETSFILLGTILASTIPTLFMTLMLGSWSDHVGRKIVIAIAIFGSITECSFILIIMCFKLPIFFLMLSSFISGMCGYFPTIILSVFSYIADITQPSERAFRLGILEAVAFISGMVSHLSSGWWIERTGYVSPYWLITSLHFCAFLYTIFLLPESLRFHEGNFHDRKCHFGHLQSIMRLFKDPRNGQRGKLLLLICSTACMMLSSTGFGCVFVLYALDYPLCLNSLLIGYYLATSFLIQAIGTVLGLKYLSLLLPPLVLTQVAVLSVIGSLCCMAFVQNRVTLFLVPVMGCLGGIAAPELRAMMSEIVDQNEQGALFAAVAAVETVCTLLGAVIFNCLYPFTMHFGFSGFSFLVMAFIVTAPLTIMQVIKWKEENKKEKINET